MVTTYPRLVDQAVAEAEKAREALDRVRHPRPGFAGPDPRAISPVLEAAGHFEACTNCLHRAVLKFGEWLRRQQEVPAFPRYLDVFRNDSKAILKDLRHGIQHMDERILEGETEAEDPPTPFSPNATD